MARAREMTPSEVAAAEKVAARWRSRTAVVVAEECTDDLAEAKQLLANAQPRDGMDPAEWWRRCNALLEVPS